MPQDVQVGFDQSVLEMIEHSSTGSIPHTPSYQDALKRLYATHQVYASADNPHGHVTARSLTQVPHFYANNLEALIAGSIDFDQLETNASVFSRYVASLSPASKIKAETFRARVVGRTVHHRKHVDGHHDPVHSLFLLPGVGPHPGLPGNYLHGYLSELSGGQGWALDLHDSDDGAALFQDSSLKAALEKWEEVRSCAPFTMDELEILGFKLV